MSTSDEDHEMAHVLGRLREPDVPDGAVERLLANLPPQTGTARVLEFKPRPKSRGIDWRMAVPLAASILLGLYLGTTDLMSDWIYGASSTQLSASGIDDAEDDAGEDV
jgi:hypothetical protein